MEQREARNFEKHQGGSTSRSIELPDPDARWFRGLRLQQPDLLDWYCLGALAIVISRYTLSDVVAVVRAGPDGNPVTCQITVRPEIPASTFLAQVRSVLEGTEALPGQLMFPLESGEHHAAATAKPHTGEAAGVPPKSIVLSIASNHQADAPPSLGHFSLSRALFSEELLAGLPSHFAAALTFLRDRVDAHLARLSLMSKNEWREMVERFNGTESKYFHIRTLHELVDSQASATPDAPAVRYCGRELSYEELNGRANWLARHLREALGVSAGDRIGVAMRRSEHLIVALLAILKAGAAYVPIDPKHPWSVIRSMTDDAEVKVLLVDSDSVESAVDFRGALFVVDVELGSANGLATGAPVDLDPGELAYVIYTSGSTGRAKGVAVPHCAIVNTVLWRNSFYQLRPDDLNLQLPSFAFDSSVIDIFCTLSSGGCLLVPEEERRLDLPYLADLIAAHRATRFIATPSYYRQLIRRLGNSETTLRSVTLAGETLHPDLVALHYRRLPRVALYNEYGPTENAVCSTATLLRPGDRSVPIGNPIANVKALVLDRAGQPAPPGVPGEIFLNGAGLARGYLNEPELTRDRFVPSPFPSDFSGLLYKTGDVGWWRSDGQLEFIGRIDHQVKIRGYRVELDHVEQVLNEHPAVRCAAVVCRQDSAGNAYLAAHCCLDHALSHSELRKFLSEHLPFYMIPETISILPDLPLTVNGKIDRQQLREIAPATADSSDENTAAPATNPVEAGLLDLCRRLFKRNQFGPLDNFFEAGGNSLTMLELVSQVDRQFGAAVTLLDAYTNQTVSELAAAIQSRLDPLSNS